jgi:hypothetical protein
MSFLTEEAQLVAAIIPVDLSTAANNGDWVSLKNYDELDIIIFKAAGTAGDDPVITLKQASDVAGTGAKALNFTRVDAKVGVQTGIGQFTKNTQAAGNTYTDLVSAESQGDLRDPRRGAGPRQGERLRLRPDLDPGRRRERPARLRALHPERGALRRPVPAVRDRRLTLEPPSSRVTPAMARAAVAGALA